MVLRHLNRGQPEADLNGDQSESKETRFQGGGVGGGSLV